MEKEFTDWRVLLTFEEFEEYSEEYGPQTQAVANAFATLETISWFKYAGSDVPEDADAISVSTWDEAVKPILHAPQYAKDGHLPGPTEAIQKLNKGKVKKWHEKAKKALPKFHNLDDYVPEFLEKHEKQFLHAYLQLYLENLLLEIITDNDSTYFRELLSWYEAGFFPCGWEGEYPEGQPVVF